MYSTSHSTANEPNYFKKLYVKPTYAVLMPDVSYYKKERSTLQIQNQLNLRENKVKGELSKKSQSKLKNAINWLWLSAEEKTIYHKATQQKHKFKLNFITLTLPTTEHNLSDHQFKRKILKNFFATAKYKFNLTNYVWKVETQDNGNIHAHITSDCFIHYDDLRHCWNKILKNHGLMAPYTLKHQSMNETVYIKTYFNEKTSTIENLKYRFAKGCQDNWANPNSTDVKAVHKVKDMAAYLIKYLSKNESGKRQIDGHLWGCSRTISSANNLTINIEPSNENEILPAVFQKEIEYKIITTTDKLTNQPKKIGELFFIKLTDWGTVIQGELYNIFANHLFKIRSNNPFLDFDTFQPFRVSAPVVSEEVIEFIGQPIQTECPF